MRSKISESMLLVVGLVLVRIVTGSAPALGAEPFACEPEPTDMTIGYGMFMSGTDCEINPAGESDIFRFDASAGDRVRIRGTDKGTSVLDSACIELRDPDGMVTANGSEICHNSFAEINEVIQLTGAHRIKIRNGQNLRMLSYGLVVEQLSPRGSPNGPPLCYSCGIADRIETGGDVDPYFFLAEAGDFVEVRGTDQGPSVLDDVCVELLGPSGLPTPLGSKTCHNSTVTITEVLEDDGFYLILVTAGRTHRLLNYQVELECLAGTCPPPEPIFSDGFESGDASAWSD